MSGFYDYGSFKIGGVEFPLDASTVNSLLQDGDPALFYLLDFCKWQLEKNLGNRWAAEAAGASPPLKKLNGDASAIVGTAIHYDPIPHLPTFQFDWPILAVFRVLSSQSRESLGLRTHDARQLGSSLHVLFMLPPLTMAQMTRLHPILSLAVRVLADRVFMGGDSAWQSGQKLRELMAVDVVEFDDAEYGSMRGQAQGEQRVEPRVNSFYPAVLMRFKISEARVASEAAEQNVPFTGANTSISVKDDEGEIVIAELEANP